MGHGVEGDGEDWDNSEGWGNSVQGGGTDSTAIQELELGDHWRK